MNIISNNRLPVATVIWENSRHRGKKKQTIQERPLLCSLNLHSNGSTKQSATAQQSSSLPRQIEHVPSSEPREYWHWNNRSTLKPGETLRWYTTGHSCYRLRGSEVMLTSNQPIKNIGWLRMSMSRYVKWPHKEGGLDLPFLNVLCW